CPGLHQNRNSYPIAGVITGRFKGTLFPSSDSRTRCSHCLTLTPFTKSH
ncbi:MAG: hypothetical protein AVDCRST_MAG93-7817, partial [uncultured Chloroflexia bacterium]